MAMTLLFAFSTTAFASDDTLHKVNGIGKASGGSGSYTSTTTTGGYKITVQGTSNNSSLRVTITVRNSDSSIVISKEVILNGKEYTLRTYTSNSGLPADTYTISVVPKSSSIGYEVSTMFYYK